MILFFATIYIILGFFLTGKFYKVLNYLGVGIIDLIVVVVMPEMNKPPIEFFLDSKNTTVCYNSVFLHI